jgi:hypothetical protein
MGGIARLVMGRDCERRRFSSVMASLRRLRSLSSVGRCNFIMPTVRCIFSSLLAEVYIFCISFEGDFNF